MLTAIFFSFYTDVICPFYSFVAFHGFIMDLVDAKIYYLASAYRRILF